MIIRSQRILIVDRSLSEDEAIAASYEHDCVAVIRGVPGFLMQKAVEENWSLPHVFTEDWEEPDPVEA